MDSFDPPSKWNSNARARDRKRLVWIAAALVLFGASTSRARDLDAENLRWLAQAEKNAGNVAAIHLVEAYQAIAMTTTSPQISSAREWSESFCTRATDQFMWDRKWRLIVYVPGRDQPAHSCRIPTKPERLNAE